VILSVAKIPSLDKERALVPEESISPLAKPRRVVHYPRLEEEEMAAGRRRTVP
jgi:hypothetical protein